MRVARAARTRERWAWAVLALAFAGCSRLLLVQRFDATRHEPGAAAHFLIDTAENMSLPRLSAELAMSPDGRNLVFPATATDGMQAAVGSAARLSRSSPARRHR